MPFYTYRCPAGHVREALRSRDAEIDTCPCGEASRRDEVNRIGVTGFTPVPRDLRNYRKGFKEYQEAIAEVGYAYQQRWDAGEPVVMPDYAGIAAQRVKAMGGPNVT